MVWAFYFIIGSLLVAAFLHEWAKKEYTASRTIVINRSTQEIFAFMSRLKNQPQWMPWWTSGNGNFESAGKPGALGETLSWRKSKSLGPGLQKTIKIKPDKIIETQILLYHAPNSRIICFMAVKPINSTKSKTLFGVREMYNRSPAVFELFYYNAKISTRDLEKGLQNLKTLLEENQRVKASL